MTVSQNHENHLKWIIQILNFFFQACGHIFEGEEDIFDSQETASLASTRETEPVAPSSPPATPGKQKERTADNLPTPTTPAQPQNLQQEFSLVNLNIPNLTIDEVSWFLTFFSLYLFYNPDIYFFS